jgi:predicted DNA-binding protein YlxM (UPF0122 family)
MIELFIEYESLLRKSQKKIIGFFKENPSKFKAEIKKSHAKLTNYESVYLLLKNRYEDLVTIFRFYICNAEKLLDKK